MHGSPSRCRGVAGGRTRSTAKKPDATLTSLSLRRSRQGSDACDGNWDSPAWCARGRCWGSDCIAGPASRRAGSAQIDGLLPRPPENVGSYEAFSCKIDDVVASPCDRDARQRKQRDTEYPDRAPLPTVVRETLLAYCQLPFRHSRHAPAFGEALKSGDISGRATT